MRAPTGRQPRGQRDSCDADPSVEYSADAPTHVRSHWLQHWDPPQSYSPTAGHQWAMHNQTDGSKTNNNTLVDDIGY